jgi:hypothetical protein
MSRLYKELKKFNNQRTSSPINNWANEQTILKSSVVWNDDERLQSQLAEAAGESEAEAGEFEAGRQASLRPA